jgi:hypothetical protein
MQSSHAFCNELARRRMTKQRLIKIDRFRCKDGPFAGADLFLSTEGGVCTAVFRVGRKRRGRYSLSAGHDSLPHTLLWEFVK